MIGFYNYTVVLTYMGLVSSLVGMMFAANGCYKTALVCLALSGLCDMFDGKVARRKQDRTDDEKNFGIQIDSLCDVVCFGIFPAFLAYSMGMKGIIGIVILAWYTINGVVRLAYFNVMETKRQEETDEVRKYYSGLPITTIAIIFPVMYMLRIVFLHNFMLLLHCTMLMTGTLFVVDFPVKKPKNITLAVFVAVVAIALLKIFHIA